MSTPFDHLPITAANHFRLHFYAAVSQVTAAAAAGAAEWEALAARVSALRVYHDELAACGVPPLAPAAIVPWWADAITAWESGAPTVLPIREVRERLGVDPAAMFLLASVGMIEEDARFGAIYDLLNDVPGQTRPTVAALATCWHTAGEAADWRFRLRELEDAGLVRAVNPDAPRLQRAFEVSGAVWDALAGARHPAPTPWSRLAEPAALPPWDALVLPEGLRRDLARVPALLAASELRVVVVRGPQHNGRHTVLAAVARALGCGVLSLSELWKPDDRQWREASMLATALHALPVVTCDPAPGEVVDLPRPPAFRGPIGVVTGTAGAVAVALDAGALVFDLPLPDAGARRQHWQAALGGEATGLEAIAERYRLTGGYIRRAAAVARTRARVAGRTVIAEREVGEAARALNAQALDALAARVPVSGNWTALAAREETLRELVHLERRCRHRERLGAADGVPVARQCGVRALFRGPSGTGKTLAARLLASVLEKDLYRVDLSAIVNKYIGETEKNLERVLARAEELDVVLLLDEGDALLTQRTGVSNANDRYANLETNFLLQRLEAFDGILVVTTNAGERIDAAFERRMDVVVEFQPPQPAERWDLWQLHLPASHRVDAEFLNELATRCALSGGQIRNAMMHASLLALDAGGDVDAALVEAAVRREYRKAGAVCPLRGWPAAAGA